MLSVVINVLVFLGLAPLFEGVIRKVTARVQSRQGPPLVQPYYDLLKLLGKENLSPSHPVFHLAPMLALASILSVVAFLPLGRRPSGLTTYADIVTVVYLLTLGGVAVLLGALASRNTYALLASSREMTTMIMIEPVLAMTLILGAVRGQSLGIESALASAAGAGYGMSTWLMLAVYLLALQAFVGRQPFDLTEAEVEILEGPFIEYSGPNYALFRYYLMLKQMFYAALFVVVFVPGAGSGHYAVELAVQLALVFLVFLLIAVVGATNPRLRLDQAQRYYAVLVALALVAVGMSTYGL